MKKCILLLVSGVFLLSALVETVQANEYAAAVSLGRAAAREGAKILDLCWSKQQAMVLTNAGYARPGGMSTQGCLDGLHTETGASVGRSTLVSLQSRFDQPLWFALYTPNTGQCAYLQIKEDAAHNALSNGSLPKDLFSQSQKARIDAESLFAHPEKFAAYQDQGLFGANLFRVTAALNLMAQGAPDEVLQAIVPHDHYCPGVASGVLMARYIQENIFPDDPKAECFVLSLDPWCKEDALISLLNATPGKRGYGILYPGEKEVQKWPHPLDETASVVFVRQEDRPWQGWLLGFDFDQARKEYAGTKPENPALEKLALGLWLVKTIDESGRFVTVHKTFELDQDMHPRELLRPENNPIPMLSRM
jgi:formylmethanofuran dehydrogenase subunit E-like metal-binding protein